jgi:hypothetical protein
MLGGLDVAPLAWVVAMFAIVAVGIMQLRSELVTAHRRMTAPIERDVVEVISTQVRGPYGRHGRATVTVQNRDGGRRELVVAHQPGLLQVGDVGVIFTRADAVWEFHRVERPARY